MPDIVHIARDMGSRILLGSEEEVAAKIPYGVERDANITKASSCTGRTSRDA